MHIYSYMKSHTGPCPTNHLELLCQKPPKKPQFSFQAPLEQRAKRKVDVVVCAEEWGIVQHLGGRLKSTRGRKHGVGSDIGMFRDVGRGDIYGLEWQMNLTFQEK